MRVYDREELAWAAGIFDGEGHVRHSNGGTRLCVAQKGEEILRRFLRAVQVGSLQLRPAKGVNYYHTYSYDETQAVVALLWPWLSSPKQEQARSALREGQRPVRRCGLPECNNVLQKKGRNWNMRKWCSPKHRDRAWYLRRRAA